MAAEIGGAKAPKFTIPTTAGTFRLGDQAPDNLVVYFYPRDNTPGCTLEGADFRDLHAAFRRARTRILGISTDGLESHRKFREKMKFPFELGSDEDHAVASLFGAWKLKSLYGRKSMGVERSTFLIDAKGRIRREWRKVRVKGHAAEVLEAAKEL
ncbi:MAG TPA: peroxiredoxin [Steroidobacteraceae bacterium]|nr:peroxiredoxin [Steroidobacteraceae bacterium]